MSRADRSISHWTGGGGRASATDLKHYHGVTEFDGNFVWGHEAIEDNVVTSDGDYARHTLHFNTRSAGFGIAGMREAIEEPFDPGPSPINEKQFEAHCAMLAEFHRSEGLPVERDTCLTHAEVEATFGIKQHGKWDLTRLPFKLELRGAYPVGDYMRERVRAYMGVMPVLETNRPILRYGDKGAFVLDLQDLLRTARSFVGKLDGQFGRITLNATRQFQDHAGLTPDGIVGPATWAALMDYKPIPKRHIEADDLRLAKSRTMASADAGQKVAVGTAAFAGVGTVLETVSGTATQATSALTSATGGLDLAQRLITAYWPLLIAIGAAGAIWYYFSQVKNARVEDAHLGRNLGR